MLRNYKLQIQPQAVHVSHFSILTKPTSRKTVASSDMAPDTDPVQAIAPVLSGTSKFFTPLPTSKKIDVSSNLSPDPSSDLASRKIVVLSDLDPDPSAGLHFTRVIDQGFNEPFLLNGSWRDFETIDEERKLSSQLWYAGRKQVWMRIAGKFMTTYWFAYDLSNQLWLHMAGKFMTTYIFANNMSNQLWLCISGYLTYLSSTYKFISSFVSLTKYAGRKLKTGFRFYPTSETEHYQFMRLHEFIVK